MNQKTLHRHFQLLGYRKTESSNPNRVKHPYYPMVVEIGETTTCFDHVSVVNIALVDINELNTIQSHIYGELYDEEWKPRSNPTI
jgi:hypothetical protein